MRNKLILTTDQEHVYRAMSSEEYYSSDELERMTGIPASRLYYTILSLNSIFTSSTAYNKNKLRYMIYIKTPLIDVTINSIEWYEFNIVVYKAIYNAIKRDKTCTYNDISRLFNIPIQLAKKSMEVAKIKGKELDIGLDPNRKEVIHPSWIDYINKLKRYAIDRLPNLDTMYLRDTPEAKLELCAGKHYFTNDIPYFK